MPASCAFCLMSFLVLLALPAYADTKTLTAEATYIMGDGETPSFAEAMALQKAKQMALEEAGTYVESYTKTINQNLTKEEIQTLTGGVLHVEVLEKTRTLVSEGLRVSLKIRAIVATDQMEELARRIKGKNVAEEYQDLRIKYAALTTEISELKQTIATSPSSTMRETALNRIREREQSFTELQRDETVLFEKLVQGDLLVAEAKQARHLSDAIIRSMLGPGVSIEIGELKPSLLRQQPSKIQVEFEVTLRISDDLSAILQKAAQERGATEEPVSVYSSDLLAGSHFGRESGARKQWKPLLMATLFRFPDTKAIRDEWWYLRESLRRIQLIVEFLGETKTLGVCRLSYDSHLVPGVELQDSNQKIPVWGNQALADEVTSTSKYFGSEAEYQEYKHLEELQRSIVERWQQEKDGLREEDFIKEFQEVMNKQIELAAQPQDRWLSEYPPLLRIKHIEIKERLSSEEPKTPFLLVMNESSTAQPFNLDPGGSIFGDLLNGLPRNFTMSERALHDLRKTTAHLVVEETPSMFDDRGNYLTGRDGCRETTTGDIKTIHVVKPGETLYRISRRYGVKVQQLREWNNMPDDIVEVGQTLIVGVE